MTRVYNLVRTGFLDGARFFRIVPGFVAQFGIAGDPTVDVKWEGKNLPPEQVKESNKRGTITFAQAGGPAKPGFTATSRTTQMFINYADRNTRLDSMGFAPVGKVIEGMEVADGFFSGYGEQPNQNIIHDSGNKYLESQFPNLDYIKQASVLEEATE